MEHETEGKTAHSEYRAHKAAAVSSASVEQLSAFGAGLTRRQTAILGMQQTHGNAAVLRMLAKRGAVQREDKLPPSASIPDAPDWAEDTDNIKKMQKELLRLGVYTINLDGVYGGGTDAALVEAFGSDEFRTMSAEDVVTRLQAAKTMASKQAGQKNLRYGELFKDGILDITIGLGYDEYFEKKNDPDVELNQFKQVLSDRGFTEDKDKATELYQQAGRELGESAFGLFFVKENALTYNPPAGDPTQIHAVVRLVADTSGKNGGEAAGAFKEGMEQSDVSYYAGHGRYGSGPDFDRNFESFELLDEQGTITQTLTDYDELEKIMAKEGASQGRDAWKQFLWRYDNHRINVNSKNEGNVFINPDDVHSAEFGAKLMYWNLQRTGNTPVTGKEGELGQATEDNPDRKYRILVFDGCRTQDYEKSIRSTPGYSRKSTDTIETTRTVSGSDDMATLGAFLDSILGQQSAQQVVQGMNQQQKAGNKGPAFTQSGTQYDPVIR